MSDEKIDRVLEVLRAQLGLLEAINREQEELRERMLVLETRIDRLVERSEPAAADATGLGH
jgi:hypothetical protein